MIDRGVGGGVRDLVRMKRNDEPFLLKKENVAKRDRLGSPTLPPFLLRSQPMWF